MASLRDAVLEERESPETTTRTNTHVTTEILGKKLTFAIDPDRLSEAGVVWDKAVTQCASAIAPMIKACTTKSVIVPHAVNILELGAGTGALGIGIAAAIENTSVCITDLQPVVYLMDMNVKNALAQHQIAKNSKVKASALPWSVTPDVPDPRFMFSDTDVNLYASGDTEKNKTEKNNNKWHFVLACETLYWGGWDVFDEDTRSPQLATMKHACSKNPDCLLVVAFTVRDKSRETNFVLDDVAKYFWLKRMRECDGPDTPQDCLFIDGFTEQLDTDARAYIEGSNEGDLLLFQGKLKS